MLVTASDEENDYRNIRQRQDNEEYINFSTWLQHFEFNDWVTFLTWQIIGFQGFLMRPLSKL